MMRLKLELVLSHAPELSVRRTVPPGRVTRNISRRSLGQSFTSRKLEPRRILTRSKVSSGKSSWRMIEYARAQAQAQKLTGQVEFLVADALRQLMSMPTSE